MSESVASEPRSISSGSASGDLATVEPDRQEPIAHVGGRTARNVLSAAATKLLLMMVSFPAMLGALLVGGVATIARTFFVDPDVWWHIKSGQMILATHQWPSADPYSFSVAGQHWIAFEWLGDVLLATMYHLDGMRGLELLLLVLGSGILSALYALATIRSGNSKAGFVATAAVFVLASVSFNLRPQMLGYLFLILTLIILERFRKGQRRAVWALPLLMLVWVNAHGSWVIGLGVIGIYWASGLVEFNLGDVVARRWSSADRLRLASILALCFAATIITPYGTALAKFPFEVASSLPLSIGNILEWQPMPFGSTLGQVFLVALMCVIAFQVLYRYRWPLHELALFIFAVTVACLHVRFLLIFVPIFTPILATMLSRWMPAYQRAKDRYLINAFLMAVIAGIVIWNFPSKADLWRNAGKKYPVAAVEYLNSRSVPGPMYNAYGFGGYLILMRWPQHKVFMDGRSELYERAGLLADYLQISHVKSGALAMLDRYGIQSCLLEHDEALATVLAALPHWQKVYEDSTSILFVRRDRSQQLSVSGLITQRKENNP